MPDISGLIEFLKSLDPGQLQDVLEKLIARLPSPEKRRRLLRLVKDFLYENRWYIALAAVAILGLVLIANPVALAGFGALGPTAGSLAAAWQSSIGCVAAGSLFATLQALGMTTAPVLFPALGAALFGTAVGCGAVMYYWDAIVDALRKSLTTLRVVCTPAATPFTMGGPFVAMGMMMAIMGGFGGSRQAIVDMRRRGALGAPRKRD